MSRFLQKLVFLGVFLLFLSGWHRLSLALPADYHFTNSFASLQQPGYDLLSCTVAGSYHLFTINQAEDNSSSNSGTPLFTFNGLLVSWQTAYLRYSRQEIFRTHSLYLLFRKLRL